MEDFQQPIKELIEVLKSARAKARSIKDLAEPFLIKVDNTLARLINSSAHAVGLPIEEAEGTAVEERGPVTSMFGKDLSASIKGSETKIEKAKVTEDVLAALRAETATIIARIPELSPKQFHEQYQDAQIRRVAKKLGMAVTTTDPEQITLEFVREIFEVAAIKADKNKAIAEADLNEKKEVVEQTGQEPERAVLTKKIVEAHTAIAKAKGVDFGENEIKQLKDDLQFRIMVELREMAAVKEHAKEETTAQQPTAKPAPHSSNAVPSATAIGKKPVEKPKTGGEK